jgi:DNA-binding protein H-NS
MAKINGLDKMSYAELSNLRDRVDAAMIVAKAAEKDALLTEMEAMAARAGLSLSEVLGGRKGGSKLKGSKVAIKYRNPKNADETWTGRGRKPNWLVAALKKGQKMDAFAV